MVRLVMTYMGGAPRLSLGNSYSAEPSPRLEKTLEKCVKVLFSYGNAQQPDSPVAFDESPRLLDSDTAPTLQ